MTAVGDIIQAGQPIPDDVTEVRDRGDARHELDAQGRWHQGGIGNDRHPWDADELSEWSPLTVTAVREQPARDAAEPTLLDLVRQYGDLNELLGEAESAREAERLRIKIDALFARIAALVPTLPVQARYRNGLLWWIHGCGEVTTCAESPTPECRVGDSGPWRPLLVAPDAAPDGDKFPDDDLPLTYRHPFEPYQWRPDRCGFRYGDNSMCGYRADHPGHMFAQLDAAPDGDRAPERCTAISHLHGTRCIYLVQDERHEANDDDATRHEDENGFVWIVVRGRDRAPKRICPDDRDHNPHRWEGFGGTWWCKGRGVPNILREIMAALGVDRAEDVLDLIPATVLRLRTERDEARAELTDEVEAHRVWQAQCAEARAEVERYRRLLKTQAENFAAAAQPQDGPIVLRLPEPPPGTVALRGVDGSTRYVRLPHDGSWSDGEHAPVTLAEVLEMHDPEGVTVELAPEPEPQQPRTAAEVWLGLSEDERACVWGAIASNELAEALDREAGR
jgi:hypothetical protein